MIEIRVKDENVEFATHKISFAVPSNTENLKKNFPQNRLDPDGFISFSDTEKNDVETRLTSLSIGYSTTDISPSPQQIVLANSINGLVETRSQALDYINSNGTKKPHTLKFIMSKATFAP